MHSEEKLPAFLITIDTEGDNSWRRSPEITCRNAEFLHRFQQLCERFSFRPTWLTNYEMASSDVFAEFALDVIRRGTGEIGAHLHAWNSPPEHKLTVDDLYHHPYLIEYPESVMREKLTFLTQLLEERFGTKMLSHRAGRWAFNGAYARLLLELGYKIDCSVTPHVSWRAHLGNPSGEGGTDYRHFSETPYFIASHDIAAPAASGLLEVPMTITRSTLARRLPYGYRLPHLNKVFRRAQPEYIWLRPNGRNLADMLDVVRIAVADKRSHIEFMLHSSEFMPGGSPTFPAERSIEVLYEHLEQLFSKISRHFVGMTLAEYHSAVADTDSLAVRHLSPIHAS